MHTRNRTRKLLPSDAALLEPLESRQFLSAAPLFVLNDPAPTLIGTLSNKNLVINEDLTGSNSAINATINWGDGTTSPATLHRTFDRTIQVWAGHAYSTLRSLPIQVMLTSNAKPPVSALKTNAHVVLNALRGRTIAATAGKPFTGVVSNVQRSRGLPLVKSPQTSIDLPPGAHFAQYTVPDTGAVATFSIDWGDGSVSPGTVVSNGAINYKVSGTHAYSAAGSFRIVTYVIIENADHLLLHTDLINSTAHVVAGPGRHAPFALPQHTQVNWGDVLPSGTTIPPPSITTPTTGGASGTSVNINGNSTVVSAGTLMLNNGSNYPILTTGTAPIPSGETFTIVSSGAGSSMIYNTAASGSATFTGLVSSGASSSMDLNTLASSGLSSNTLIINPGNSGSNFRTSGLTLLTSDWIIHSNGSATVNGSLTLMSAKSFLPSLHKGTLTFDPDVSSDQILAALNLLPADYSGTITLPIACEGLPTLSAATIFLPIPTDPA